MRKSKLKKIIGITTVAILLMASSVSVFATDYWGSSSSYSAGSYSARHASYMSVNASYSQARTKITSASGSLPPGTMGVKPRAYYASGSLAKSGSWSYTDGSYVSTDVPVDVSNLSGYMYSQGQTALWNGTSYTVATTTPSPNAQNMLAKISFKVNKSGQTYGSALFASEDPDLILTVGIDGVEGYIKSSDLNSDMAKSPEEAIKLMNSKNVDKSRFIPLYKSDGKTVIGEFEVSPIGEAKELEE